MKNRRELPTLAYGFRVKTVSFHAASEKGVTATKPLKTAGLLAFLRENGKMKNAV
jgi:hypothetical protein